MTGSGSRAVSLVELLDERAALLALAGHTLGSRLLAPHVVQLAYLRWSAAMQPADRWPLDWLQAAVSSISAEIGDTLLPLPAWDDAPVGDAGVDVSPRSDSATTDDEDLTAEAFAVGCRAASAAVLGVVLAAEVRVIVDHGGHLRLRPTEVRGRDAAGELLGALLGGQDELVLTVRPVSGSPGIVVRRGERVVGVLALALDGGRVHQVWAVLNPEKLVHWNRA